MIRQQHAAAFMALMGTASPVYDGGVPAAPAGPRRAPPYRVVHLQYETPAAAEDPARVEFEDSRHPIAMRAYVHSVGETARAARAVADHTYELIVGQELAVPGRVSYRIRHEDSQPPDRDESTGVAVYAAVDVYAVTTVPA